MELGARTAMVTGGATGIGRAIADKLAGQGADIVVCDVNREASERAAEELRSAGARSLAAPADVSDAQAVADAVTAALDAFGNIDILVNNAGVVGAPGWHQHTASREEDWEFTFRVNVSGMATVTEAVIPQMRQRGSGKIVNLSSVAGRQGRPVHPHYSSTKAAVINYTQTLAHELAVYDINVNAVCPGLLWTPMWEEVGQRYARTRPDWAGLPAREVYDRMVAEMIPLQRGQTPDDIAEAVAFLVSDDARNITGQAVNVDGGLFLN